MEPASWKNPQAAGPYDLIVVGGDALAVLAAERACAAGARIALVSDHPLGLDAIGSAARSSLLLAAGSERAIRQARRRGWPAAAAGAFDFPAWRRATERLALHSTRRFSPERLRERGVDVYLGPVTFQSPGSLRAAGQSLSFVRALVALHADWAPATIPGLAELDYLTPDTLGRLDEWPRHWAIIGSDAAACELAQTLAALGATVDLIAPDGVLAGVELDIGGEEPASPDGRSIASLVARRLEADGVRLWVDGVVAEAARTGAAKGLLMEREGQRQWIVVDEILVITHRHLDVEWLRLPLAGLVVEGGDITADRPLAVGGRVAAVPARELPDALDREALAALARFAADAGLGIDVRQTPARAVRRLRFDPPIAWIGDCGPAGAEATDRRVSLSADMLWWIGEAPPGGDELAGAGELPGGELPPDGDGPGVRGEPPKGAETPAGRRDACELRLRIDSRRGRLRGAIVVGREAQRLVGPLTQMIVDGSRGQDPLAGRAELEWLARLVAGPDAPFPRGGAWWRRLWRALERRLDRGSRRIDP